MSQCTATTAAGQLCKKRVQAGSEFCASHNGKGGRPTIFSDELGARVIQVLRAGGYAETAARVAGIDTSRLSEWMRKGDPAGTNPRYAQFRQFRLRVEAAKAEAEARNVALIAQAASSNWQAAAWLLERMYPERWARVSQRGEKDEAAPPPVANDTFTELDELAQRRRTRV